MRQANSWRSSHRAGSISTVSDSDRLAAAVHVADARAAAGDLAGARAVLADALAAAAVELGRDHLDVLSAARSLAGLHRELGELADARRVLEEARAAGARTHGEGHPLLLLMAYELATLVDQLGNTYEARRNFELVAQLGPGVVGADHEYVVAARGYLDQEAPATAVAPPPLPAPAPAPVPPAARVRPVRLLVGAVVAVAAVTAVVAVVAFQSGGTDREAGARGTAPAPAPVTTTAAAPVTFDGRYAIRLAHTGMCVGEGPELFKETGRTVLGQHPCATASPPTILEPADAAYRIKLDHPVDGIGCATIDYGGTEEGLLMAGAACEAGRADQTFTLEPVTLPVAGYRLRSVPGRRFCIGAFEASRQDGAQLMQTTCGDGADQVFTLERR